MSVALLFKRHLKNISPSIGLIINKIPFSIRPGIGEIYSKRKIEIQAYNSYSIHDKQCFILGNMKSIVNFAYHNVSFYREHYDRSGFHPKELVNFSDIEKIPVVNKELLRNFNLEKRSTKVRNRYIVNTGGSSGSPFDFYVEPDCIGHEWAHMHTIWENLDYKPSDLKLAFAGRSDLKKPIEYDVLRNHFAIDLYTEYHLVAKMLRKILKRHEIKYLHGYPSSIYDFALYCRNHDSNLQRLLSNTLVGAFLGSEYPHKHYREIIEDTFKINTVSWYGHTERAVLAYEKHQKFVYEPFQTYGFSEAIHNEGQYELIGTSYYNHASPLIRYNTNDVISDVIQTNGILDSFKITKGREGEFVIDKNHKKINLTALIFGRHHNLFGCSKFIQVKQIDIGKIIVYYVADNIPESKASEMFDSKNVDIDVLFSRLDEPIRTISGKINLLIK